MHYTNVKLFLLEILTNPKKWRVHNNWKQVLLSIIVKSISLFFLLKTEWEEEKEKELAKPVLNMFFSDPFDFHRFIILISNVFRPEVELFVAFA